MSAKTRAETLAEELEAQFVPMTDALRIDTAAELRRLSASEAALLEALESAMPEMAKGYSATQQRIRDLIARTKEARNA